MKNKKKLIICIALAIALIAVGVAIGVTISAKNKTDETSTTSTTTTNSLKINTDKSSLLVDGGVAMGVCTYKGVDYVVADDGIFAVTATSKKQLTSQKVGFNLCVFGDKLYYTVKGGIQNIQDEDFGDFDWRNFDCYVMNLDGSGQRKLFDLVGDGFVICSEGDNIYYADIPIPGIHTGGIGYNIYKYNLKTGEKLKIEKGTYDYSVDNIFYYDGYIYYKDYTDDNSGARAAAYDIKTGKKTEITDICTSIHLAKDGTVYMVLQEFGHDSEGVSSVKNTLASYSINKKSLETIKEFSDQQTIFIDKSDKNNLYLTVWDYTADMSKSFMFSYNKNDGFKQLCEIDSNSRLVKFDAETNKLIYFDWYDNEDENNEIIELYNNKRRTIGKLDKESPTLLGAGEYSAVLDYYIDGSGIENDYLKREVFYFN